MERITLILLVLILSGCNFTSRVLDLNYHREAYIEAAHPEPKVAEWILERKLGVGMTESEVVASWGHLWRRSRVRGVPILSTRRGGRMTVLFFRAGKVRRIDSYGF